MSNFFLQNPDKVYALSIPTFSHPELLHDSFEEILNYNSFDKDTLTFFPVNDKYTLIFSSKYYQSYDFINYYATCFYRHYTNIYYKSIYGPALIVEHNDLQLIPYILLEEINSLIKIYK